MIGWLRRWFRREDSVEDLISAYVDSGDDADDLSQVESRLRASGVDVDELRSVRETSTMLRGLDTVEAPKSYALTAEMLSERGYSDREIDGILNPQRRWGGIKLATPAVYVPLVIGALALIGVAVLTIGDITEYATERFTSSSDTVVQTVIVEKEVIGVPGESGAPRELGQPDLAGDPGPTVRPAAAAASVATAAPEIEKVVEKEVIVHSVVVEKEVEVQAESVVETVVVKRLVEVEKEVTVVVEREVVVEVEKEVVVEVEKEFAVEAEMMEAEVAASAEESSAKDSGEMADAGPATAPMATASVSPTPDPCLVIPTSTPTASSSPIASSSPTVTPTVSLMPTCTPTPTPTPSPTPIPMQPAAVSPTSTASPAPTQSPTPKP